MGHVALPDSLLTALHFFNCTSLPAERARRPVDQAPAPPMIIPTPKPQATPPPDSETTSPPPSRAPPPDPLPPHPGPLSGTIIKKSKFMSI